VFVWMRASLNADSSNTLTKYLDEGHSLVNDPWHGYIKVRERKRSQIVDLYFRPSRSRRGYLNRQRHAVADTRCFALHRFGFGLLEWSLGPRDTVLFGL
jgi:hypothetical protein